MNKTALNRLNDGNALVAAAIESLREVAEDLYAVGMDKVARRVSLAGEALTAHINGCDQATANVVLAAIAAIKSTEATNES